MNYSMTLKSKFVLFVCLSLLFPLISFAGNGKKARQKAFLREVKEYNQKGILFFAKGTDPVWSLEFDKPKNQIRFLAADGMVFASEYQEPMPDFHSKTGDLFLNIKIKLGNMQIRLKPQVLRNDSQNWFYNVVVDVKYDADRIYQHYEGFGRYVPDERLQGTWKLSSLNGKPASAWKGKKAWIQLDVESLLLQGNNSCNALSGDFLSAPGRLEFSQLASTRMFCEGSAEAPLMLILRDVSAYQIQEKKLRMQTRDGRFLEWKK